MILKAVVLKMIAEELFGKIAGLRFVQAFQLNLFALAHLSLLILAK
jgi:hypothetical protein